ncbi:SCP2 domain-containing protein [Alkalilimnicola sp. S0819]|uniref:ubiquinone biosynthesis accessory factor UbiJ n=1 Tax=Alkalilimnicola sp. S0819 TaxID=2613922 RepID=UPI00128B7E98|nr:SCP2 sterol-binding domain-containing protein [Alkalilimnicola sp. S0819]
MAIPIEALLKSGLWPLEQALNRLLGLDPETEARLRPLAGRHLQVELEGAPQPLQVHFSPQGLSLLPGAAERPEATLRSSPGALIGLALRRGELRSGDLSFQGDVGLVQGVQKLFGELDIDWEEQLAGLTGDVLAHQIGRGVREGFAWLARSRASLTQSLGEYLSEEARYTPPRLELEGFYADVDRLREGADRLAARLVRLERRRGAE